MCLVRPSACPSELTAEPVRSSGKSIGTARVRTGPGWCRRALSALHVRSPGGRGCVLGELSCELTAGPWQVDDILGEGSDDSDSEKRKPEEPEAAPRPEERRVPAAPRGHSLQAKSPSKRSAAEARGPR